MEKILIIGDVHGNPIWKDIVIKEQPTTCIFIGDYFDNVQGITPIEEMSNFESIINFKLSGKCKVHILLGNHDYHYWVGVKEEYSGYKPIMRHSYQSLLYDNKEHLKMCHREGEFLFTHAGVSEKWLEVNGWDQTMEIDEWVNEMFKYKPSIFGFQGWDPYGDSPISSPIWIRPPSLQACNKDNLKNKFIQVVGHTQQTKIDKKGKSTGGRYYYIDTLNTSKEYMMIVDNEIKWGRYSRT